MGASSLMKTIDTIPKSLRIRFQDSKPTTSPTECGVPQRSRSNIYNVALIVIFDLYVSLCYSCSKHFT